MHPQPIALVAVLLHASSLAAAPVGVAVVGFTGGPHAELKLLASRVRQELAAAADPAVMTVVSRDAMSAVYAERGAACSPGDTACIVDASTSWGGRLFVRGATAPAESGVIVTAALESVRGFRVAAASIEVASLADADLAAPVLVRDLLAQERAFRESMAARSSGPMTDATATDEVIEEASDICHGFLTGPVPRWGDLVFDGERIHFRTTGGMSKTWSYVWSDVRTIETIDFTSAYRPGITLTPTAQMDFLIVAFESHFLRDRCFRSLTRARGALP